MQTRSLRLFVAAAALSVSSIASASTVSQTLELEVTPTGAITIAINDPGIPTTLTGTLCGLDDNLGQFAIGTTTLTGKPFADDAIYRLAAGDGTVVVQPVMIVVSGTVASDGTIVTVSSGGATKGESVVPVYFSKTGGSGIWSAPDSKATLIGSTATDVDAGHKWDKASTLNIETALKIMDAATAGTRVGNGMIFTSTAP